MHIFMLTLMSSSSKHRVLLTYLQFPSSSLYKQKYILCMFSAFFIDLFRKKALKIFFKIGTIFVNYFPQTRKYVCTITVQFKNPNNSTAMHQGLHKTLHEGFEPTTFRSGGGRFDHYATPPRKLNMIKNE